MQGMVMHMYSEPTWEAECDVMGGASDANDNFNP
jgi:hypothetical protein